jgi:hypothetical protein
LVLGHELEDVELLDEWGGIPASRALRERRPDSETVEIAAVAKVRPAAALTIAKDE